MYVHQIPQASFPRAERVGVSEPQARDAGWESAPLKRDGPCEPFCVDSRGYEVAACFLSYKFQFK